jgi:transposase
VIVAVVAVVSREVRMAYYVGVDVGLRSSSLCIIDELGGVCLERAVASEIEEIALVIRGFADQVEGVALDRQPCSVAGGGPAG